MFHNNNEERLTLMPDFYKFIFNDLVEACDAADNKAQALKTKVQVIPCDFHNAKAYIVTERFTGASGALESVYIADYSAVSCSD